MPDLQLTQQQETAAYNRGGSLLVAAAAGSGKTKVLVERLFGYLAEGANVDDFLVITYTNAAAAELRGKIAQELTARVAADPENTHLRRQLFRVYQADIKTVDAFCTSLLRENAYLLPPVNEHSFTPDFHILDEKDNAMMQERVLAHVLEDFYDHMDERRALLAETLGAGRNDDALAHLVLDLYTKVQSHPYPLCWLDTVRAGWETPGVTLDESAYGRVIIEDTVRRAEFWAQQLEKAACAVAGNQAVYAAYGDRMLETASVLKTYRDAALRGWDDVARIEPTFRRMGSVRGESEEKSYAKALVDQCKNSLKAMLAPYAVSQQEHLADLAVMTPAMLALIDLTKEFMQAYQAEKARRNAMDFSDQEHYAIALLLDEKGQPTPLARRMAEKYREIMVDEYQDTNDVQNCIFDGISRDGENLFTVGDVKQSIYRFRLANPTIFLQKYLAYPDANAAAPHEPRRVLLSKNFRSRRSVLESTNFVFRHIMSPQMGEMVYGDEEQLYFGADYYRPRDDEQTEFHYINVVNTEEENFNRVQVEAGFVAHRIRQLLDTGYPVQGEDGAMRPCTPEDIVILMRSPRARMKDFTAALARENIPCASGESGDVFETIEIAVTVSFLKVIDNPRQDVPLLSVLRSPLVGFTPDRLARIRALCRDVSYYDALLLDEGEDTKAFLTLLHRMRAASRDEAVDTLVWHLYDECHLPAVFGAMAGGEERCRNLTALYTYVREMASTGKKSLFDFITYLNTLMEQGKTPELTKSRSAGGVRIMTIHKSKGLEFPIVILADLNKRFDPRDFRQQVLVHQQLGLGTECVDRRRRIRYDTISKTALTLQLTREGLSEEMRILYVAMTRAKEKLILVNCVKNGAKRLGELANIASLPVPPEAVAAVRNMGEWVLLPLLCAAEGAPLRRLAERSPFVGTYATCSWQVQVWENPTFYTDISGDAPVQTAEVEQFFDPAPLEAVYPHLHAAAIPTKLTATQLKGRELDAEIAEGAASAYRPAAHFEKPLFLREKTSLTGAEKGTAMHLVMQYIPFTTPPTAEAVQAEVMRLTHRRLLTEQQAQVVDCSRIAAFLASPLCRRIRLAQKVYREYRFALLMPATLYDSAATDEEIMLQGVADCVFETAEGLVIVDFKTDRIQPEEVPARTARYRPQLDAYGAALSRVLDKKVCEKILYFFHGNIAVNL